MSTEIDKNQAKKNNLYGVVIALATGGIAFRVLLGYEFEQYSILFLGIPILLTTVTIKYTKPPKTAYGIVFRTLTLFLLMASVLFGEGTICIIMAAPLFYGVAALIVYIKNSNKTKLNSLIIFPLLILLMEPISYFNKPTIQNVSNSILLKNNIEFNCLNKEPNILDNYPLFFKMGFPKPKTIIGKGIDLNDERKIGFESSTKGLGHLNLKITESSDSSIVFTCTQDNTHIAHWLTWQDFKLTIHKDKDDNSVLSWTSRYTCDLSPRWYFEPLERYAVKEMNNHLLNTFFN